MPRKSTTKPAPETAIVPTAATRVITPAIKQMLWEMAPHMHKSHLFGVTSPEQAYAIMTKGYEVGLSATASFEFVQVIQGRPSISPRGAMALLANNPFVKEITVKRLTDNKDAFLGYECKMVRVNGIQFTSRFTLEDAKRAGLLKPDSGWTKYPENMSLWRAVGFAADFVFPDVLAGMTSVMKAPEMYGVALTEGGDIIDASSSDVPSIDPLQELVNEFGAEAVMAAANGKIPANGEVEEVRRKLEMAKEQS